MRNLKSTFGINLKQIRKENHHTLDSFSQGYDVTPRTVKNYEDGKTEPSARFLLQVSAVYKIDPFVLMYGRIRRNAKGEYEPITEQTASV